MYLEIVAIVTVVAAALLAFGWGGRDEQLAAIGFLAATLATRMIQAEYQHIEMSVLAVDFGLLLGLLALALTSDRFWPMYAAAFQLLALLVHVGSLTEQGNFAWAYAVALIFWSYAVIGALLAGTWLEGRSRRLSGL